MAKEKIETQCSHDTDEACDLCEYEERKAQVVPKGLVLESEARDMRVTLDGSGLGVTLLGHRWRLSWEERLYDPILISTARNGEVEGHNMIAKSPRDCPGCSEFVKEQIFGAVVCRGKTSPR